MFFLYFCFRFTSKNHFPLSPKMLSLLFNYIILYYIIFCLLLAYNNAVVLWMQVLIYTAGHINYGGRVTDDWDRRCMMNVLSDYYNETVLTVGHLYDASGVYKQLDPSTELEVLLVLLFFHNKLIITDTNSDTPKRHKGEYTNLTVCLSKGKLFYVFCFVFVVVVWLAVPAKSIAWKGFLPWRRSLPGLPTFWSL